MFVQLNIDNRIHEFGDVVKAIPNGDVTDLEFSNGDFGTYRGILQGISNDPHFVNMELASHDSQFTAIAFDDLYDLLYDATYEKMKTFLKDYTNPYKELKDEIVERYPSVDKCTIDLLIDQFQFMEKDMTDEAYKPAERKKDIISKLHELEKAIREGF